METLSFSERVKGVTEMATVEEGLDVALMSAENGLGEKRDQGSSAVGEMWHRREPGWRWRSYDVFSF